MKNDYEQLNQEQIRRERRRKERLRREQLRRKKIRRIKRILLALLLLVLAVGIYSCSSCGKDDPEKPDVTDHDERKDPTPTPTPQSAEFVTTIPLSESVTVCIDAGHGFSDPGCVSENLENGTEADITLKVAKILKEKLEAMGVDVILTHDGETYPSAQEVMDYANQYGIQYSAAEIKDNDIFSAYERAVYCQALGEERTIDFFISLHINSVENTEVSRYDIYYSEENPYAEALSGFCTSLEMQLDNRLLIHETTRGKSMLVTKYSKFPSVLLEMGFATNEHDAANLNSPDWRNSYCKILAEQIVAFALAN